MTATIEWSDKKKGIKDLYARTLTANDGTKLASYDHFYTFFDVFIEWDGARDAANDATLDINLTFPSYQSFQNEAKAIITHGDTTYSFDWYGNRSGALGSQSNLRVNDGYVSKTSVALTLSEDGTTLTVDLTYAESWSDPEINLQFNFQKAQ